MTEIETTPITRMSRTFKRGAGKNHCNATVTMLRAERDLIDRTAAELGITRTTLMRTATLRYIEALSTQT